MGVPVAAVLAGIGGTALRSLPMFLRLALRGAGKRVLRTLRRTGIRAQRTGREITEASKQIARKSARIARDVATSPKTRGALKSVGTIAAWSVAPAVAWQMIAGGESAGLPAPTPGQEPQGPVPPAEMPIDQLLAALAVSQHGVGPPTDFGEEELAFINSLIAANEEALSQMSLRIPRGYTLGDIVRALLE